MGASQASVLRLSRLLHNAALDQRAVAVVDANFSQFDLPHDPLSVAHSVRAIRIPQAEGRTPRGLQQPLATGAGMWDDFESDRLNA